MILPHIIYHILLKFKQMFTFTHSSKKRTDWNKFPNIMSTFSSLNLKLKNFTDTDNAINTFTNNIQDTLALSSTTTATQDNSSNFITPEISKLIFLKCWARNTCQWTQYAIDRQWYNYFFKKLKLTLKKHKKKLYISHLQFLSLSNESLEKNQIFLKASFPPLLPKQQFCYHCSKKVISTS